MWRKLGDFIFGRRVERKLPDRIRAEIAREQAQSELLIAWIQLLLVGFFCALYTATPKTSYGTPFEPVPYVLVSFFLYAGIRVLLTHAGWLPSWFQITSVIIDIALLLLLIWSFHLQYQQPAPFYLKAPTMLYLFIFIAVRALRFEPTSVLVGGITAAIGWIALVAYAYIDMGPEPPVTRDYVEYLTSNVILIGGEVDKVITIVLVTAVLTIALIRARRSMMRSIVNSRLADDLTRFVAPEVASQIASSEHGIRPGDGQVKTASVVFCDIQGFMSISERLSPDQLMRTLNDYFEAVSTVIDRHHGAIAQFQGDAMLITYNTVTPDADHAANALKTALGIQEVLAERRFGPDVPIRARCGVNTGDIVAGAVGTRDRLLFTVHGDEVNIAARLEQLNKTYGTWILATEQTLAAAGDGFFGVPMGTVQVRGRQAPVRVFAIAARSLPLEARLTG